LFFHKKSRPLQDGFFNFSVVKKEKAANFDDARGFSGIFRFYVFCINIASPERHW